MSPSIDVLLVDDHRSVLWGLERLIESTSPRMRVTGSVTRIADARAVVDRNAPDVIVLDLDLGDESGLTLLDHLPANSRPYVLILSGLADARIGQDAIRRGARGMINKSESAEVILKAIERVNDGEIWLDRATTGHLLREAYGKTTARNDPTADAIATLTQKEREVIAFVVSQKGASNKIIADALCISAHTLRNHLAAIYGKLDVHSRLDLYMFAQEHALG